MLNVALCTRSKKVLSFCQHPCNYLLVILHKQGNILYLSYTICCNCNVYNRLFYLFQTTKLKENAKSEKSV